MPIQATRRAVEDLIRRIYARSVWWRWLANSVEQPIAMGHPSGRGGRNGAVAIDGRELRCGVFSIEVRNFGPGAFARLSLEGVSSGNGTPAIVTVPAELSPATFMMGARQRTSDRAYWLDRNQAVSFDVAALTKEDRPRLFGLSSAGAEQWRLADGDYVVVARPRTEGISRARSFRMNVGNEGTTVSLLPNLRDARLSTSNPGWWWLAGSLLTLAVVGVVAAFSGSDLPTRLIRAGLVGDIWGVVSLAWSAIFRSLIRTPGMVLGGGYQHGDDHVDRRESDRATIRGRIAVVFLVGGFCLQIAGQSL